MEPAADRPLAPFVSGSARRARFSVTIPTPRPLDHVDGLLAGAVDVDITPPPGLPKAGYSANAHDGAGFHTRLRARVLHLRAGTTSLAIVQCDLLGGSSVLQHLVADAISTRTDIPLAGVMIGATHTHAGPGQFLGTDFYNRFASNRSGFDPAWTDFLVQRISDGVVEAYETRRPARMAMERTEVWGWTRNRSLPPHLDNDTVPDKRTEPQRKFAAVNPWLNLLRVDAQPLAPGATDDAPYQPLAAMVVFSVHGTGVSMHAPEYNADLWAYLVGELSHRIEVATGTRAVVGAIEGTHADIAPAIRPGLAGHREAQRIGQGVGGEAFELYERMGDRLTADVELAVGLREVDFDGDRSVTAADGTTVELPRRPAIGAALVAGAHENLTPVIWRIPPFKAGTPKPFGTDNAQGEKWTIGSRWLQPLILPLKGFPRRLPVQVIRLGTVALVGLPFEITTESGRRIQEAATAALDGSGVERVVVSSVANEYSGYVATAEEYRQQYYEGGHTIYGPRTQRFFAAHAANLAADVARGGVVSDVGSTRSWDLKIHRYLPEPTGATPRRVALGPAEFHDTTKLRDGFWELSWRDAAPGDLAWHQPMARVESSDDGGVTWAPAVERGRRIDDGGWALEITHLGGDEIGHRYSVRWYDPVVRAGRLHRFVLLANAARPELVTAPFD